MADNVPITPGVGASVATDDVGGVQYQRVKVTFGVDGSAADVSAASPLPITAPSALPVSATSLPLPTGAALDATLTGGTQQSKITDGSNTVSVAGSSAASSETAVDRLKVNAALRLLDTGQAAGSQLVSAKGDQTTGLWVNVKNASIPVTGAFFQATQPVSLATNTPTIAAGSAVIGKVGIDQTTPGTTNLVSIGTNGTVAINAALPTGSNVIGALTANQSINNAQINGVTPLMGNGITGTGSQRVTIASDNTAFSVNSNLQAGSNLVGKVGIDQTTVGTTNAVALAQIGANTILTGNGVTGTGSQRVTIASDNTAFSVNAVQSGTWTVQPGNTANTTPWLVKPHDGTNAGTIKAASTAAAFTDTALVVDPRPGGALVTASAALADALANPTLGRTATLPALYNGTTWDLQRGMGGNATTGDTGAKTANGSGATQTNVGNKGVQIVLNIGTVTGTSPTILFKVQGSADGGTTWYDVPGAITASLTATGVFGITVYPGIAVTAGTTVSGSTATANMPLPRTWRLVWAITGTTPSFTITNIQYNYIVN